MCNRQTGLNQRDIDPDALKVLYRLHRSGYRAYLCGGSVRDLLTNRAPKDFDVATDAHPMEIRRLFRNSRIIGRRFRLVHIIFQDMIVEVSTFRREPERVPDDAVDLLITDDNTFGSPLQDARRRDFTINAMFYNIADFSVIDYVGGLTDMEEKRVRVIGDPDVRAQVLSLRLAVLFHHARTTIDVPRIRLKSAKRIRFGLSKRWLAAHPLTAHLIAKERRQWKELGYAWKSIA